MATIVGHVDNYGSYQKMKAGYDNAEKFIEITGAKKRSIRAMDDGIKNVQTVPLLLSEKKSGSGPLNVLVKLNSVKRDVLQMMNKLPVEVNIEIADKIRAEISSGNWPTNKNESNNAIKAMMRDFSALMS